MTLLLAFVAYEVLILACSIVTNLNRG